MEHEALFIARPLRPRLSTDQPNRPQRGARTLVAWMLVVFAVGGAFHPGEARSADAGEETVAKNIGLAPTVKVDLPSAPEPTLSPAISITGATPERAAQLLREVEAFTRLGLALPDLDVRVSSDEADCSGAKGLFESNNRPWQISVCSDLPFVFPHELAHAWERSNLDEADREAYMELRGLTAWHDKDLEWSERGVEDAAFIIQQGLLDRPARERMSAELAERLEAFEFLTGISSPRVGLESAEPDPAGFDSAGLDSASGGFGRH